MCLLRVNTEMWKLYCLILLFHCAIAQRVSKLKCDETSSLNTDSRSLHPYLVEFMAFNGKDIWSKSEGTLISEDYVLATGYISFIALLHSKEGLYVRKLISADENYLNTKLFSIQRVIVHELYNKPFHYLNDIALVQLTESIPYRSTTSIFRPACLWTDSNVPSNTYQLYPTISRENQIGRVTISKEFTSVPIDECTSTSYFIALATGHSDNVISANTVNSHMCFDLQRGFEVQFGSPIIYKQGNKHFTVAILSHGDSNGNGKLGFATKISNYIEWIESIVWPNASQLECGKRNIAHTPMMIYGHSTYHGEFPWHVGLLRNGENICGGTIISKTAILTAAHCVQDGRGIVPANWFTVITGTHRIKEFPLEAKNYVVRSVKIHENYIRSNLQNDIAILKVNGLIEYSDYIQPICISDNLPYNDFPNGTIAGWGNTEYNNGSDVLLQATLPIYSTAACLVINRPVMGRYLNENNYCAGILNGTNVGKGDSGGGMVFEFESQWYLRGIVSLGIAIPNTGRTDPLQMAFFANVPLFYNWIIEHSKEDN